MVARVPTQVSAVQAATMPISYLTALYALTHVAQLSRGETVLIQYASGGLGIAALQVAQYLGADIYATVGSDEKRELLVKKFGIDPSRIFNSRHQSSLEEIMMASGRRGIDVILCSSPGDLMHETWRCIAPFGRFIEVGRTNVLGCSKLSMDVFKRNATFSSFDVTMLYEEKPALYRRYVQGGRFATHVYLSDGY